MRGFVPQRVRGLGQTPAEHLDKLESIPGFTAEISKPKSGKQLCDLPVFFGFFFVFYIWFF